ncbi:MAG: cytochrome c biogenesis protein CcsA [Planctomycetota bacterium]|nr:cytochrome c biogenesis protein CcsA [Planctomycetota bacterium]MDA1211762.1 cytochrome c biogenesis protein CcsA [Planctomycetota bacterium]
MSAPSIPQNNDAFSSFPQDNTRDYSISQKMVYLLTPLASLKLTVTFFALAIFLIFAGTLAQVDKDIWEVVDTYFRSAFVRIPLQVFFPQSFFPSKPIVPGAFWYPGGWLIGAILALNLLSAHLIRFKVQAKGPKLMLGLGVLAVGALSTWMVIESGSNPQGLQAEPMISWTTLWRALQLSLVGIWIGTLYLLLKLKSDQKTERWFLTSVVTGLGIFLVWLFMQGDAAQLGDSSMRILWQLIKATVAGLVLLAGCAVLFGKRAGVVLLHSGIGLMMFSEVLVGVGAKEAQMSLDEGQTSNFVRDIRTVELAFVDTSNPDHDIVTVVPRSRLSKGVRIADVQLPVDIELVRYLQNSDLRKAKPDDKNPATVGSGVQWIAEDVDASTGTDMGSGVDMSSAYIEFFEKGTDKSLGVYLVGVLQSELNQPETLVVGDKTYDLSLRFERSYKDYSVTLLDVRKDDYLGTDTPRNYSSDIHIVDPSRGIDEKVHIWMNNPLRFAGETFYQSGYHKDPRTNKESTTLAVVTNTGWMIPYVSCMIVAVGLLAHFSITLVRFLNRRQREEAAAFASLETNGSDDSDHSDSESANKKRQQRIEKKLARSQEHGALRQVPTGPLAKWFPLAVVLIFGGWLLGQARMPKYSSDEFNLNAFGELPIVAGGRQQPVDALARNTLRSISNYQTYVDADGKKQPAIRWFLDVATQSEAAENHNVFRIDHPEIVSFFEIERVKGHRYSLAQLRPKASEFHTKVEEIQKKSAKTLSVLERRYVELDQRIRSYTMLVAAFSPPPIPSLPTEEDFKENPTEARQKFMAIGDALMQFSQSLSRMSPPLAVPVGKETDENGDESNGKEVWEPYAIAWSKAFLQTQLMNQPPAETTLAWNKMMSFYGKGDVAGFNKAVADYKTLLETDAPVSIDQNKVEFEAFFNHAEPFYHASVLYVLVFVLSALAWFGWSRPLNRAAFWLTVFTFVVHTAALIARIYISGRPPVTNLYSSAIFIGWGAVIFGMIFEVLYKLGIGNLLAGVAGFSTLVIAHLLAADGDTFVVLQAVLDTQFWLATHVVCITFGYATTFVAGILGVVYVVRGLLTKSLTREVGKNLTRMIYGTLCFAIFFSFVGTVLGGLWADDSWGRFWGWDPKENGALMIVIWNALVLHARWGAMVKDRGLAMLAVVGNIITAWSWFGVNELGVGLHSYGFTDGVLMALGLFVVSQLVVIVAASLPVDKWRSGSLAG